MTTSEKKCQNMADVCALAHYRTVRECNEYGYVVDCPDEQYCGDQDKHTENWELGDHYTKEAQTVFDRHYNHIIEVTGL